MAQFCNGNVKTLVAGGAIAQFLRVILNGSGQLAVAGGGEIEIGSVEVAAFVAGDEPRVRLRSAAGTYKMVASGAIAQGGAVYGDAGGKVTANPNANFIGFAFNAASGNNSIIEVIRADVPAPSIGTVPVEAHTANYAVAASDAGKILTNTGAAGEVDFTLPAATVGAGPFIFALGAAQTVKVLPNATPGTDQLGTPSTATVPATGVPGTAGHGFSAAAIGATVQYVCTKTGLWQVTSSAGAWTAL